MSLDVKVTHRNGTLVIATFRLGLSFALPPVQASKCEPLAAPVTIGYPGRFCLSQVRPFFRCQNVYSIFDMSGTQKTTPYSIAPDFGIECLEQVHKKTRAKTLIPTVWEAKLPPGTAVNGGGVVFIDMSWAQPERRGIGK